MIAPLHRLIERSRGPVGNEQCRQEKKGKRGRAVGGETGVRQGKGWSQQKVGRPSATCPAAKDGAGELQADGGKVNQSLCNTSTTDNPHQTAFTFSSSSFVPLSCIPCQSLPDQPVRAYNHCWSWTELPSPLLRLEITSGKVRLSVDME